MTTGHSPYRPSRSSPLPLILAGAAFAMTAYLVWDRTFPTAIHSEAEPRTITPRGDLADYEKDVISVYEANRPSVVNISKEILVRTRTGYASREQGSGSGFVWDSDGYLVTNYHVIQGEREMLVRMHDQREIRAVVVGARPDLDIAVLRFSTLPPNLRPIALGTSADLRVGQTVLAIGNPYGLDQSLSTGVISALDRSMQSVAGTPIRSVIQVDAAINPGNSGGPLLDSAGRLIGMNTAIKSPTGASAGIGFAVPVDTINRVVPELIQGHPSEDRPALGFQARHVPIGNSYVVMVEEVFPGSGAAEAGLRGLSQSSRVGDVILGVEGREIRNANDILEVLSQYKPGDRVRVDIVRGLPEQKQQMTLEVKLSRASDFGGG